MAFPFYFLLDPIKSYQTTIH